MQDADLHDFVTGLKEPRKAETLALIDLYQQVTGFQPRLWPTRIIGFGKYEYAYKSGRTGVSLATGFSPRSPEIVVYFMPQLNALETMLGDLGKHRAGKGCLYLRKFSDANPEVLAKLIRMGLDALNKEWPVQPN